MPVQVQQNDNTMRLTVTASPNHTVNLDMSLQRHHYGWLDGAQAKPQNSILYHSVTIQQIQQDLRSIGEQIEIKIIANSAVKPSLQSQLKSTRQAMDQLGGFHVRQAVQIGQASDPSILFGDYLSPSGRTYRVDNVATNRFQAPNHCYPIQGPNLWLNVNQQALAAAAALSWLQKEMRFVQDSIESKWNSMQHMPPSAQNINSLYRAMSGARTHFRGLPPPLRNNLFLVSGQNELLKGLAKISA